MPPSPGCSHAIVVLHWALILRRTHPVAPDLRAAELADAALDLGDMDMRRLWLDVLRALEAGDRVG